MAVGRRNLSFRHVMWIVPFSVSNGPWTTFPPATLMLSSENAGSQIIRSSSLSIPMEKEPVKKKKRRRFFPLRIVTIQEVMADGAPGMSL